MKKTKIGMLIVGLLVVIGMLAACVPAPKMEKVTWSVGTSKEGSAGYVVNLALARVVNKYVLGLNYVSMPTAGSTASVQFFGKGTGEIDGCYPATPDLHPMYTKTNPYEEMKWLPYQAFWVGSAEEMLFTKADRDDITCYSDLAGKKAYFMGAGTSVHALWKRALTEVGVWDDIETRDMGTMDAADALEMGTIDATCIYVLSKRALCDWGMNIDARIDIKVVNPTPEEAEAISVLPFVIGYDETGSLASCFSQPLEVDKIWSFSSMWGFMMSPDTDVELMYQVLKAWDEHTDELVEMAPTLIKLKDVGLGPCTAMGIECNPDVPVHGGTAKFLKEKGLWQDEWIIGEYIERSPAGLNKIWQLYGLAE